MHLETNRLLIRPIEEADLEAVRQLHNNPEILRWLTDAREVSQQGQQEWYEKLLQTQKSKRLVLIAKTNRDLVGVFRLDQLDLINLSATVGLDIDVRQQGQGYAREAYNKIMEFLFKELKLRRLDLETLEGNFRAIRLYESLGFTIIGRKMGAILRNNTFHDLLIMACYNSNR
jgi:RimJ/RimL family protein N-acetyltransferase